MAFSRKTGLIFSLFGPVLFILLTIIGMFFYPGGTNRSKTTVGYSFHLNAFSDMGRTIAQNDIPNPIAHAIFGFALLIISLSAYCYFTSFPHFIRQEGTPNKWINLGSKIGQGSVVFYIAIALIPLDISLLWHSVVMVIAFLGTEVGMVMFTVDQRKNHKVPTSFTYLNIVFVVITSIHLILLGLFWHVYSDRDLMVQALGQKMVVYWEMLLLIIQSLWALKTERTLN